MRTIKKDFPMVKTPKGIMYLTGEHGIYAYCYDDQTGMDEVFLLAEVAEIGMENEDELWTDFFIQYRASSMKGTAIKSLKEQFSITRKI